MPSAPRVFQPRGVGDKKTRDRQRGTASERGYGTRWQKAVKVFLVGKTHCGICGKFLTAKKYDTVVDHIKPHRGDQELFWSQDNWQVAHKRCHDEKTARGE